MLESFFSKIFLRYPNFFEFIKFAIVGVTGTIVDFGVYAILTRLFYLHYLPATAISVFLAIINNFILNKYWTFKQGNSSNLKQESVKFFVVSVINYFLNLLITYIVIEHTHSELLFGAQEDFFAKAVAIGIVLFSNYFANKYWTFRKNNNLPIGS